MFILSLIVEHKAVIEKLEYSKLNFYLHVKYINTGILDSSVLSNLTQRNYNEVTNTTFQFNMFNVLP